MVFAMCKIRFQCPGKNDMRCGNKKSRSDLTSKENKYISLSLFLLFPYTYLHSFCMHKKAEDNYNISKISISDISTISSNNSQRYSDNPLGTNDIGQFDIIDDLDYDDVDDGLIGITKKTL